MKPVAVFATLIFAAGTVATVLIHSSREPATSLEQARSEKAELTRRLDRLEQLVSARPADRPDAIRNAVSEGLPAGAAATRERSTKDATAAEPDARKLAEHAEHLQASNAVIDRAIQAGRWSSTDMVAFGSATSGLSGPEKADIMARLSAAVNSDRVQLDLRPRLQ